MSKLTKNQKLAAGKIEAGKAYSLAEASALVKELTFTKRIVFFYKIERFAVFKSVPEKKLIKPLRIIKVTDVFFRFSCFVF